jgi:hypothetical protein
MGTNQIKAAPDSVKRQVQDFLATPDNLKAWCNNVVEGVRSGDKQAMTTYGKSLSILGGDADVALHLLCTKELGVSIEEARRRIEIAGSVEGVDEAGAVTMMEQCVRDWYASRGKRVVIMDMDARVGEMQPQAAADGRPVDGEVP